MDFEIRPVSLDHIETADHTFKISTTTDKTELAPSIGAIGLLQPPVLIKKGPAYRLVNGFRRVSACHKLKIDSIPARLLRQDCSRMECACIAIADNSFQRSLNIIEQARAYALILGFVDPSTSWMALAKSVGLPASQASMERILPVADMSPALQESILCGNMALPIALQINRLNQADAIALDGFFRKLSAGLNVQRELLDFLVDISHRDGIPLVKLIEQEEITGILENKEVPAPQKVQALRKLLKTKRYPELSNAEHVFHRMLKSLKLSSRIQIQPPPFFEGKTYRVTLRLDSRKQLKSIHSELDKLASHPHFLPE